MNALLVGQEPSQILKNALIRLNIRILQRVGGGNVAALPGILSPAIEMVIIFADSASQTLADRMRERARRFAIPVLCCRPSVSALAVEWSALQRGGGRDRGSVAGLVDGRT